MAHRKQSVNVQLDHPDVIVKQGERGLRQGHNVAFAHHGEIVQGVFETQDGRLWRGLVALPCNLFHSTNSIMFENRAVLFAYRDGTIIEDFNSPLPLLEVIGFNTDSTGFGVDTLNLSPVCYSWWEIEAFRPILGLLRRAFHNQDVRLIGQAASASARINQRHLPKPHFERLEKLVESVGAAGLQIAHSGTIAGIIFDANDAHKHEKMLETQHLLAEMKFDSIWHFQTPNP